MLETIQQQIAETHDRQAVMILMQGLPGKLAILKIATPAMQGELWFANGKYLVYGKASPGGDLPLLDMLRLLAIKEGDFSLEVKDEEPPACDVSITIAELVADEHAVARKIKNVLWPVAPANAAQLNEEISKEQLKRLETTKNFSEEEAGTTSEKQKEDSAGAAGDQAKAAAAQDPDETVQIVLKDYQPDAVQPVADNTDTVNVKEEQPALDFSPPPSPIEDGVAPVDDARASSADEQTSDENPPEEQTLGIANAAALAGECEAPPSASAPPQDEDETIELATKGGGPDAERFYERDNRMSDDDLAESRAREMEALNRLLDEHRQKRSEKAAGAQVKEAEPVIKPDETTGKLQAKRRAEYEALKLFNSEEPERFYEKTGVSPEPETRGLDDFKKRILEIAGQELSDEQGFQAADPRLKEGGDIRPVWSPKLPHQSQSIEQQEESATDSAPAVAPEIPSPPPSPYADAASAIVRGEATKTQLGIAAQADDLQLLERPREKGAIPRVKEAFVRRKPLPTKIIIAAVVGSFMIPTGSWVVWHYFDAQAQEELTEQREAVLLANRCLEEKSMVAKPQEPFRMPAGSTSPLGGTESHGDGGDTAVKGQSITQSERDAAFVWQPPKEAKPPLTGEDMQHITLGAEKAERLVTQGKVDEAISIYLDLVRKYPNSAQLRAKVARLCIKAKRYRDAYGICIVGMQMSQTRSDFELLQSVKREIPVQ